MLVKEMDLQADMIDVVDAHRREYMRGRGVWRRIDFTDEVDVLVRSIRSRGADRYRIFLVERGTDNFVSVIILDPETINWRHKEIFYVPTSFIVKKYRGRGLVSALYRWFISGGFNLKADTRQSEFSNRLWHRLINEYSYLTVRHEKPEGDSYSRMLNPKRLRLENYTTLLFSHHWNEEQLQNFAGRITREDE